MWILCGFVFITLSCVCIICPMFEAAGFLMICLIFGIKFGWLCCVCCFWIYLSVLSSFCAILSSSCCLA